MYIIIMKKADILKLKDRYFGKKQNGWEVDEETGATIVYALQAVYFNGVYYSLLNGRIVNFSKDNYLTDLRKKINHDPIEGVGTGVIVHRTNKNGIIEVLLQLRTDMDQYGLLGGGLELGESYEECAVNELLQEAAIIANQEDLVLKKVYAGAKHVTKYPSGDIVFHTVVVYSIDYSECSQLDIKVDESETKELRWITVENLKSMLQTNPERFFPNNVPILEDIAKNDLNKNGII